MRLFSYYTYYNTIHTTHTSHITNKGSNMKALEKYHIYKGNTNEIRLRTLISQLKTKRDIIDEYKTP